MPGAADESLTGPYARIEDTPEFEYDDHDRRTTDRVLASAPGSVTVALRELRSSDAAASCLVTIETTAGIHAGPSFLCSADRSDEVVVTDQVALAVEGSHATIRFRTSYELNGPPARVGNYTVTCTLAPVLSCTLPPKIGGYEY